MNIQTQQLFSLNVSDSQASGSAPTQRPVNPTETAVALQNVQDFSKVCRACASTTEFIVPIFSGEGLENNLADKINKHMPIKVSKTDILPQVVCYQCASQLLAWHELVKCCTQADLALRTILANTERKTDSTIRESKPTDTKSNPIIQENSQSQLFDTHVKNVLVNYFLNLEIQDASDLEFVCQKCSEKPALTTVESLSEHLKYDHASEVTDDKEIKLFIKNYITFEEILISEDSDRDDQLENKETPEKPLPNIFCPFCTNVFSSPTRLVCHLNKHFDVCIADSIMCCNVIFNDKRNYVEHLQEAHVDIKIVDMANVCKSCGLITEDNNALLVHINDVHQVQRVDKRKKLQSPNNQKHIPAVCPECNKTFSNMYNMFVHMKSHSAPASLYSCDKCKKSYKSRASLTNHIKLVHEGILNFVCSECGEAFPTRSACEVHTRLHTGIKPYKCNYCKKSYRAKNTLDRHLEIHLNIRKYECDICSKKFRKKTHLDYHVTTHRK